MPTHQVELRIRTRTSGRREVRHWQCLESNATFALHRDVNDGEWNVTHRPTGCAVFKRGLSLKHARDAFGRLTDHHRRTGAWGFTHLGRIPKDAKAFGKALHAEFPEVRA